MRRFIASLLIAFLLISPAAAQAASPVSGLTVSPAIEQLNLTKDQTSASFSAQVTNNTSSSLLINISTNDFTALNESGGITFFNTPLTENPHALAQLIQPGLTQVALAPGATQSIPMTINGVDSLAPGGHYGAIVYKVSPTGSTTAKNPVNTEEEVSSLVFVTTYSGGTQAIRLDNTPLGSWTSHLPTSINAVFTDNGNTQTAPRGLVLISGPGGNEMARGIINIGSGLILPETSRLYTIALNNEHKFIYPGTYHLSIIYQAGDGSKAIIYTKSFVIINKAVLALVVAVVLLVILLLIRRFGPAPRVKWTSRPKS